MIFDWRSTALFLSNIIWLYHFFADWHLNFYTLYSAEINLFRFRFYWCLEKTKKLFGNKTDAVDIRNYFWNTLGITCFMFVHDKVCTETTSECTGVRLLQRCEDVCKKEEYRYHAKKYTITEGEIIKVNDINWFTSRNVRLCVSLIHIYKELSSYTTQHSVTLGKADDKCTSM